MFDSYLKPMEPKSCPYPFDSDEHIFQVKWDGVRILAFVNRNQVRLQNRNLKDRTFQYPEVQHLAKQIRVIDAVLDGEMISLKDGKPSFCQVLQRDLASNAFGKKAKQIQIPVIYMVFDVLYCKGLDLTARTWEERDHILKKTLIPSEHIHITESIPREGKSLYKAVIGQKLEGIIAKDRNSPYIIGGKNCSWQKIKPRKDMNCVIGGYIEENKELKSLLVGAYHEGKLKYLGKAGSGLAQKTSEELFAILPGIKISQSPFNPVPKKEKNRHWVEPILTLKIEFMEFTPDMHLRQPSIKGLTKMNPKECILTEE